MGGRGKPARLRPRCGSEAFYWAGWATGSAAANSGQTYSPKAITLPATVHLGHRRPKRDTDRNGTSRPGTAEDRDSSGNNYPGSHSRAPVVQFLTTGSRRTQTERSVIVTIAPTLSAPSIPVQIPCNSAASAVPSRPSFGSQSWKGRAHRLSRAGNGRRALRLGLAARCQHLQRGSYRFRMRGPRSQPACVSKAAVDRGNP